MRWQPLATTMAAALAFVVVGSRGGAPLRLSVSGAAVAAAAAFLVDDPAAETLAASPRSLPVRRCQRVMIAALAAGVWWSVAAVVAAHAAGSLPLRDRPLEMATLVVLALAGAALARQAGDGTPGGIAGAVVAVAIYATTYLPPEPWLPFPRAAGAPGATPRLLATFVVAACGLTHTSRDPARRRARSRSGSAARA
jgi:hypothetical protein